MIVTIVFRVTGGNSPCSRGARSVDIDTDPYSVGEETCEWWKGTQIGTEVRVLGEFPVSEDDVLNTLDLVEPAPYTGMSRYTDRCPSWWGLDLARRFGSNRSCSLPNDKVWHFSNQSVAGAKTRHHGKSPPRVPTRVGYHNPQDQRAPWEYSWMANRRGRGGCRPAPAVRLASQGYQCLRNPPRSQNVEKYQDLRDRTSGTRPRNGFAARKLASLPEFLQAGLPMVRDLVKELTQEKYDFQTAVRERSR